MISASNFPETADIETSSDNYASRFSGDIGAWLLKVQEKATLQMLSSYPNATILDVGGGHGQLTEAFIRNGHQVTVLGSAEVCQERIRKFTDQGLCDFKVGNVLELPFADRAFDVVVSYRFLAHVTQWKEFIFELSRVANHSVILDYPTVRSLNYISPLLFSLKKRIEKNTRPFVCYRESEIIEYLKTLDLFLDERCAQFFWPMVLHRVLGMPNVSRLLEGVTRQLGLNALFGSPVILKVVKS